MLEPSKPKPSSNNSADNSVAGIEKCCHNPGKSTNFKSTISTLFFFANSRASFTGMELLLSFLKRKNYFENSILLAHYQGHSHTITREIIRRRVHCAGSNPNPSFLL